MTLEKRFERVIVDCPFLFLLNQLRVILAKGGIMPDVVQTNHPINYFQRKTSPPRHLVWLSSVQVWIGGTMHPCPRLVKRPVQRRKAAISSLGEREFYFEDFVLTPQGTIYLWLLKVRPRWSLPLLLLSILNVRPGECLFAVAIINFDQIQFSQKLNWKNWFVTRRRKTANTVTLVQVLQAKYVIVVIVTLVEV